MSSRRWTSRRRSRFAGIALLIVGLAHTPLPQADYHNVRHHDAPGQVCEFHDHLLRWHPDAGRAADVAVLHWHWAYPVADPSDLGHSGQGPSIHAHLATWDATSPEVGPAIAPDSSSTRLVLPPSAWLEGWASVDFARPEGRAGPWAVDDGSPRSFGATLAPGSAAASARLQRWSC